MTSFIPDAERRAEGVSLRLGVLDDELYLLIQAELKARGVLVWTHRWPEIDLAIRSAVTKWREAHP